MNPPELSAIVLCYRAGESIGRVIEPLHDELADAGITFELVLVANYENGRDDATPQIVEAFAVGHENVRVIAQEKHGGMGWDMRTGLEAAAGESLVVIDGDAQNPTEDVLKLYRQMQSTGVDLMKGRRIARFDGFHRRVVSYVYNALFVILFGTRGIRDINAKPKGITREAFSRMHLRSDDWFIDAEMVISAQRLGLSVAEMPVVFRRNDERASFVKASAIVEFLRNMARFRLRPPR